MNYGDQTLDEFLSGIASNRVAPAGGTATAVVGAMGAALCEMVCIHSLERDDDEVAEKDVAEIRADLREERRHLLELADADGRIVAEMFPTADDDVDQSTLKQAIGVPLAIAEACLTVQQLATGVTATGNQNAVVDGASGVILAHSALRASILTARSNVDWVSDASFAAEIQRRTEEIGTEAEAAYEQAMAHVGERP